MATVTIAICIPDDLAATYDRLADATGRSRNHLMQEALEQYAGTEGWQIEQIHATLSRVQSGTLRATPGEEVIGEYLSRGWITQDGLNEARQRYGASARGPG